MATKSWYVLENFDVETAKAMALLKGRRLIEDLRLNEVWLESDQDQRDIISKLGDQKYIFP